MKSSLIKQSLLATIKAKLSCFIWGAPGVGKSQVVHQVAQELGMELIDLRAILLDPVDLRGIPSINEGKAHWCSPEFLPVSGKGILFLDELNAAPQSVQAACYQLVLDHKLGEYVLPEGWVVVAAGNRETDRAVTNRMPSALANRFIHLYYDVDAGDWVNWAMSAGIKPELIAFIRYRPALLHSFDPQKNEKSFTTPRSLEFASNLLKLDLDPSIEFELLKGTIGEATAAELVGFLRIFRDLPNLDMILQHPDTMSVPSDVAILFALSGALAHKASPTNFDKIITYINRMPKEFAVMVVRDSKRLNPDVCNTSAFITWASNNSETI